MGWARAEVERGAAGPGAVYVADAQFAGRGRHGRTWSSPVGKGLYLTVVLPETMAAPALTLAAALAAAEAAESHCGVVATIKWPNDLLHSGRKWGGVLAEVMGVGEAAVVLLGLGLNVSQVKLDFDPSLMNAATSLALAAGAPVEREGLLTALLERLEQRLIDFERGGFPSLAGEYRQRSAFRSGDRLTVEISTDDVREAIFREVDGAGRLLLDGFPGPLASGSILRVRSQEAT